MLFFINLLSSPSHSFAIFSLVWFSLAYLCHKLSHITMHGRPTAQQSLTYLNEAAFFQALAATCYSMLEQMLSVAANGNAMVRHDLKTKALLRVKVLLTF